MRVGRPVSLAELVPGPAALDGGLATELEARGYDLAHHLWSAQLLASDPDAIRDLHLDYYRCGATGGDLGVVPGQPRAASSPAGWTPTRPTRCWSGRSSSPQQARDLALAEGVPGPLLVAASVGPYGAIRHDGSEYRGHYDVPRAELVAFHAERLDVLAAAGPDLLAVETIPDVVEAEVVAEPARPVRPAGLGVVRLHQRRAHLRRAAVRRRGRGRGVAPRAPWRSG